jgi:G:T-mismatch repair DNA endonuclease (very short patch repair protein)
LLQKQGWEIFTAWECQIRKAQFEGELGAFLAAS